MRGEASHVPWPSEPRSFLLRNKVARRCTTFSTRVTMGKKDANTPRPSVQHTSNPTPRRSLRKHTGPERAAQARSANYSPQLTLSSERSNKRSPAAQKGEAAYLQILREIKQQQVQPRARASKRRRAQRARRRINEYPICRSVRASGRPRASRARDGAANRAHAIRLLEIQV